MVWIERERERQQKHIFKKLKKLKIKKEEKRRKKSLALDNPVHGKQFFRSATLIEAESFSFDGSGINYSIPYFILPFLLFLLFLLLSSFTSSTLDFSDLNSWRIVSSDVNRGWAAVLRRESGTKSMFNFILPFSVLTEYIHIDSSVCCRQTYSTMVHLPLTSRSAVLLQCFLNG